MNRRGFISLLGGAAAAPLVPWRGLIEPLISLPPRSELLYGDFRFSNTLASPVDLTEASLERMFLDLNRSVYRSLSIMPPQLIVSPQVKHLIDTDPVVREAAAMALGRPL